MFGKKKEVLAPVCKVSEYTKGYLWCETHSCPVADCDSDYWDSTADVSALVRDEKNLYKVIVTGDTADNAFGNLYSDDLFFKVNRHSPIVVYAEMTNADALEMAQTQDFEVTRARADWHI